MELQKRLISVAVGSQISQAVGVVKVGLHMRSRLAPYTGKNNPPLHPPYILPGSAIIVLRPIFQNKTAFPPTGARPTKLYTILYELVLRYDPLALASGEPNIDRRYGASSSAEPADSSRAAGNVPEDPVMEFKKRLITDLLDRMAVGVVKVGSYEYPSRPPKLPAIPPPTPFPGGGTSRSFGKSMGRAVARSVARGRSMARGKQQGRNLCLVAGRGPLSLLWVEVGDWRLVPLVYNPSHSLMCVKQDNRAHSRRRLA